MTNRIIGAAVACVLSVGATAAFAQQGAGGSGTMTTTRGGTGSGGQVTLSGTLTLPDAFHGQPPTGQPPTGQPPTAQPPTSPPQMARPPRLQTPQPDQVPFKAAVAGQMVDVRNGPQAFSVVLVVGEMEGTPGADNVPAAARKALTDLKDFLPYKNYRLLDSQWTLCCGRGAIFSRLRGLDEQEYELQLTPSVSGGFNTNQPVVNVRFVLAEAGRSAPKAAINGSGSQRSAELEKEIVDLERRRQELLAKHGERSPAAVENRNALEARLRELQAASAQDSARRSITVETSRGHRQVMDASFRMDVGETVVVGTSRIQGDKALIALLTAVPPKSGTAR